MPLVNLGARLELAVLCSFTASEEVGGGSEVGCEAGMLVVFVTTRPSAKEFCSSLCSAFAICTTLSAQYLHSRPAWYVRKLKYAFVQYARKRTTDLIRESEGSYQSVQVVQKARLVLENCFDHLNLNQSNMLFLLES